MVRIDKRAAASSSPRVDGLISASSAVSAAAVSDAVFASNASCLTDLDFKASASRPSREGDAEPDSSAESDNSADANASAAAATFAACSTAAIFALRSDETIFSNVSKRRRASSSSDLSCTSDASASAARRAVNFCASAAASAATVDCCSSQRRRRSVAVSSSLALLCFPLLAFVSRRSVGGSLALAGGLGPPKMRKSGSDGTPGGFLRGGGLDEWTSSPLRVVFRGDTRSTSSRSSSSDGDFGEWIVELLVDFGVVAPDFFPSPPRGALGGFGVSPPRRRCVSALAVTVAPFTARYDPAPNASPTITAALKFPSSVPADAARTPTLSPACFLSSFSASFARRMRRASFSRCAGVMFRTRARSRASSSRSSFSRASFAARSFSSRSFAASRSRAAAARASSFAFFAAISRASFAFSSFAFSAAISRASLARAASAFFSANAFATAARCASRRASSAALARSASFARARRSAAHSDATTFSSAVRASNRAAASASARVVAA